LLSSAWIVKKEAGIRLAPVLKNPNECAVCQFGGNLLFVNEGEANAFAYCSQNKVHVIDDEWSVHRHRQFLFPLLKLPPVETCVSMAEVDAGMLKQVPRFFWLSV
jgi:hypothetical protein